MLNKMYHRKDIEKKFNISRRIIENYEYLQLIESSKKDKMGYKLYDQETVLKIGKIRFLQLLGVNLKEIKEIIERNNLEYEKEIILKQIKYLKKQTKRINELVEVAKLYLNDNSLIYNEICKYIYIYNVKKGD